MKTAPQLINATALALAVAFTTGCLHIWKQTSFLYVGSSGSSGSSVPTIEIFDISLGSSGLPQMKRTLSLSLTIGDPSEMAVVGKSLYVAGGGGLVGQFTIDPASGALTLRGTIPAGSPPHYMVATKTTVYVASRGSSNVRVYSIDATGNLTNVQTTAVNAVNSLQVDGQEKFLFTGTRASGTTEPQVCTYAIQANGSLGATPSCVVVPGAPDTMQVSRGVLYVHFNAIVPPKLGNTNWISAWTIDPATGALTHRGTDLDIGAANTGGIAVSTNGQSLYVPRQGGFTTVGTANPMIASNVTFPQIGSQWCILPPVGAGQVLADPAGKAIYVTDPIGDVTGNIRGPRLSALEIVAGGGLKPIICDTPNTKPHSMAVAGPYTRTILRPRPDRR